ncbi:MAG: hypothetical protein ABW221_26695 [Vicinamibacteria bacterium]
MTGTPAPRPLLRLFFVLFALAAVPSARGETTLARLADDAAAALRRAARGATIQLGVPDDRTGGASSLAADLHALLQARLPPAADARRVRVTSVLSQQPGRLVFAARLVEEPDGRLIDVVSVSMATNGGDLSLASTPWPGADGAVDVVRQERSAPLAGPVLALAFLGDDRLLVLWPEEVAVYRWAEASLRLESRQVLSGPRRPVRTPGGLLLANERENAFWALTSRVPRATVFTVDGARLSVASAAEDRVPWPGVANGVRFRPGTNLVEGALDALGGGPFLALDGDGPALVAVGADGTLLTPAGEAGPRVGSCVAAPRLGTLVATAPGPPGTRDALIFLDRRPPHAERARLPVDGSVRALAARAAGARSRIVAAVENEGTTSLLALEIGWP